MPRPPSSPTPRNDSATASRAFDVPSTLEGWQAHARTLERVHRVGRLGYWKRVLSTGEVYWSDVLYDIFGIKDTTFNLDKDTFLAMVHPQDRGKAEDKLEQFQLSGLHDVTYRIVLPDGGIRWLHEIADTTSPEDPDILVGTVHDITVYKELEQKLRKQAITDELTGIYNRRYFMRRLRQAYAHYRRSGQGAVILLMDIDHFKTVNDTYGHSMGDQVLKGLADLFKERLRQTDVVGRLGGEEFAVLLFDNSVEDAVGVAEALREALSGMAFSTDNGETFRISVTCGVAGFTENDATEDRILQRADDSLYFGKHHGRNQVVMESHF